MFKLLVVLAVVGGGAYYYYTQNPQAFGSTNNATISNDASRMAGKARSLR